MARSKANLCLKTNDFNINPSLTPPFADNKLSLNLDSSELAKLLETSDINQLINWFSEFHIASLELSE